MKPEIIALISTLSGIIIGGLITLGVQLITKRYEDKKSFRDVVLRSAIDHWKIANEIEETKGFEVYYLPIWDETAPDMEEMEKALAINSKIVQIGRAAQRVPMYLEAFQVRRAQVFGAQGHSGHETFPNVIRMVAAGRLDLSPLITARYDLEETTDAIAKSTKRTDGKILVKPN